MVLLSERIEMKNPQGLLNCFLSIVTKCSSSDFQLSERRKKNAQHKRES